MVCAEGENEFEKKKIIFPIYGYAPFPRKALPFIPKHIKQRKILQRETKALRWKQDQKGEKAYFEFEIDSLKLEKK